MSENKSLKDKAMGTGNIIDHLELRVHTVNSKLSEFKARRFMEELEEEEEDEEGGEANNS